MIRPAELIHRKRDGEELSSQEISELVLGYSAGAIPDYQLAAFCMAVYFRGLSPRETFALTEAMIASGETIDLGKALGRKVVDKHSTGGVGDKTSLSVGPIVAACGVPFGKMSGRGLGHTGGTLDKLESIPGYRVELSIDEFIAQVRDVGLAIVGQTADLVPADGLLYALRDVTATVDQLSLIAASIMSKKLAGGAQAMVLDVKVGDGAFMRTIEDARHLAEMMLSLGVHAGREVVCLLTDMDQPLGAAVGNALEIREARATLRGQGPPDFTELVLDACARLLALSDLGIDLAEGRRRAEAAVARRVRRGHVVPLDRGARRDGRRGNARTRTGRPRGDGAEGRDDHAARRNRRRERRAPPRRRAAQPRPIRSTTPSASSATASAARRSRPATCSPRSTLATTSRRLKRRTRFSPRTSSATSLSRSGRCCSRSSATSQRGPKPA